MPSVYSHTLEMAARVQRDLTKLQGTSLIMYMFSPLVPPLGLLAPLFIWVSLSVMTFLDKVDTKAKASLGQQLACQVLVQQPIGLFAFYAHVGSWLTACFIMVDLEFGVGPVVLYVVFHAVEAGFLLVRYKFTHQKSRQQVMQALVSQSMELWRADNPLESNNFFNDAYPVEPQVELNPMYAKSDANAEVQGSPKVEREPRDMPREVNVLAI